MSNPQTTDEADDARNRKHAHRQSFIERPAHTAAGKTADRLQQAADFRLAAGLLDRDGATEMKRLARGKLAALKL